MNRRIFILIIISAFISNAIVAADMVELRDGRIIKGIIIEQNSDYLVIKTKRGAQKISADDIQKTEAGELPQEFIKTDNGIKNYLGEPLPPVKFEMDMLISTAKQLTGEEKEIYCRTYFDQAEKYENIVRMDTLERETWQSILMTALYYYKISALADNMALKKSSELGVERCQEQLFSGVEGEFILPYTDTLREYIKNYLISLNKDGRNSLLKKYYIHGKKIVDQNKVTEANLRIIKNCFLLNADLSDSEVIRNQANTLNSSL